MKLTKLYKENPELLKNKLTTLISCADLLTYDTINLIRDSIVNELLSVTEENNIILKDNDHEVISELAAELISARYDKR